MMWAYTSKESGKEMYVLWPYLKDNCTYMKQDRATVTTEHKEEITRVLLNDATINDI